MDRRDARTLSPATQEALRVRAMDALNTGMTQVQVAALLGVSRGSIIRWKAQLERGGMDALRARKRGPRSPRGALKPHQAATIRNIVVDRTPDQLKLAFYLWTREAVADLIQQRYSRRLSLSTVGAYLRRWNLTPQRPARRAFERDDAAVQAWLETQYPKIKAEAKHEGATVLWGDETGMRSDHTAGRSYSPRGKTPVVPCTGKRFSVNVISVVSNAGRLHFMVFRSRFNAGVFLAFLARLVRQCATKVYLIIDGHPAHKAKKVQRWLEAHAAQIRMFFLPPYAPELNPDELLNNDLKTNGTGRRRPADIDELERNVRGHLQRRQKQPHVVANFFQAEHVRYAAI